MLDGNILTPAQLDLKAMADPSHDISSERELVGREMYSLLSRWARSTLSDGLLLIR